VGSELLRRLESRARELDAELIANYVVTESAARLLRQRGFRIASHFYRMAIDLTAAPVSSPLPPGIAVGAFVPGRDDQALHAALLEAFANEADFEPEPFERWRERHVADPSLVPELWLLARDGDDIAGFALTALSSEGGFLDDLGVRAPWRRRGLGFALLTRSFAAAYAHGARRVALGVAADNPTGAVQLYERAGMHVAFHVDRYEKRLR
jgi:mycothiol synthase